YSGNSGSWTAGTYTDEVFIRPANWWDTIGFGHDDAYSNALAYRSCTLLAKVAKALGESDDSHHFDAFARKLKSHYYSRFYNPETGVLGGWRSKDGQLHDYYFTFVNSIAISYGLIDEKEAGKIMRTMVSKMREVGYTNFRLGLPGNLIPIADKDYVDHHPDFGYGKFQVYENGGATACYVYFTIHALYKLGMRQEAEVILFQMLESYKKDDFQGYCQGSNRTKDWKTWKGECWGYEGFLVDGYLALLNVLDYAKSI
ncbi:MAG: alpha-L-rhamnosidase-related protein, partial [Ignavibacteriaceae bacterium]